MIERTAYVYYSKGNSKIRLELPQGGKWVRPFLKSVLSDHHKITWDGTEKVWLISKSPENFEKVLAGLRTKYREVITEVEHSTRGTCTAQCQEAKGEHCECICAGDGHGGSASYRPVLSGVLVKDDCKVVTKVYSPSEAPQEAVESTPKPKGTGLKSFTQLLAENPQDEEEDLTTLRAMLGETEFWDYYLQEVSA